MIFVDWSQIAYKCLSSEFRAQEKLDKPAFKAAMFDKLMDYNNRFGDMFGGLCICVDDRTLWRRDIFPYYKAHRPKKRKQADFDINSMLDSVRELAQEMQNTAPFPSIRVRGAEADDIAGVLVSMFYRESNTILITGDRDWLQLCRYPGVTAFDPLKEKYITRTSKQSLNDLRLKIIKGDQTDGVPNVLSDDDTFVNESKTQGRLSKKFLTDVMTRWYEGPEKIFADRPEVIENFYRNTTMIDFCSIPDDIRESIYREFVRQRDASERLDFDESCQSLLNTLQEKS